MKIRKLIFYIITFFIFAGLQHASPETATDEKGFHFFIFVGRFHMVFLHIPIGMVTLAFIFELFSFLKKDKTLQKVTSFTLFLTWVTSIIAIVLGLSLANQGYETSKHFLDDPIFWHKWLCIVMAVFYFLAWLYKKKSIANESTKQNFISFGFLNLGLLFMTFGAHKGADMVHGKGFLTERAPGFIKGILHPKEEKIPDDGSQFAEVQKIFQAKCYDCHSEGGTERGEYRLDTEELAFKPGESGNKSIVKHQAMKSYLVELITLPSHDDSVMPPSDKPQLTAEEKMKIIDWINTGAKWGADSKKNESTKKETDQPKKYAFPKADEAVSFKAHVTPLIQKYCIKCHAEKTDENPKYKVKGKLKLGSYKYVMAGVQDKEPYPVVVPGKPEESSFYYLTAIDPDEDEDDEIMPKKAPYLTNEEQNVFKRWIAEGAKDN